MAPSYSRQLLAIAVPTLAVLITYFWFKRKRGVTRSDPGERPAHTPDVKTPAPRLAEAAAVAATATPPASKSIATPSAGDAPAAHAHQQPRAAAGSEGNASPFGSPERSPRALSTPSTPIDIVIPRELRSQRTSPAVISDEDLDIEIEKVKSMRSYSNEHSMHKLSGGSDSIDASTGSSLSYTPTKKGKGQQQQVASDGDAMPAGKLVASSQVKSKNPKTNGQEQQRKKKSKMATKVEEKLSNLQLKDEPKAVPTQTKVEPVSARKEQAQQPTNAHSEERQSSERDSANHSPADVMLASPSLSCISDNHSEGSSDSGKGGSEVATPPSRTPAGDSAMPLIYEFTIPQVLVGKLIGRYGTFVAEIKEKTRAHIVIKKHPSVQKLKLCMIEGSQSEIDNALVMIRERFPLKKHPEMTLEQVSLSTTISNVPISTDHIYLKLVEGVNNDTIVSCMMSPSHLFLQQPTHPSFPHLQILSRYMMACYSNPESPTLPTPIQPNTVCVSETMGEWCRVMILSTDVETDTSHITYLDYGGYAVVPNAQLKQIRGDFLLLPFQAAEAHLSNIRPIGGDDAQWCDEAYQMVGDLTKGAVSCTQIAEYTENGIPLVLIYILVGSQEIVFLNDELVKRGYAEYIQPTTSDAQEYETSAAVDGAAVSAIMA